eukprot:scaffold275066_cov31-Tisochrysis_lutea.AAC.1
MYNIYTAHAAKDPPNVLHPQLPRPFSPRHQAVKRLPSSIFDGWRVTTGSIYEETEGDLSAVGAAGAGAERRAE